MLAVPGPLDRRRAAISPFIPNLGTLEDFEQFVSAAEKQGLEVALDIAFQCAPDHPYVREHPEWFRKRPDGTIQYAENPPKKYQDIYPLDFESAEWRDVVGGIEEHFRFLDRSRCADLSRRQSPYEAFLLLGMG